MFKIIVKVGFLLVFLCEVCVTQKKIKSVEMECSFVPFETAFVIPLHEEYPDAIFMKCDLRPRSRFCKQQKSIDKFNELINQKNSTKNNLDWPTMKTELTKEIQDNRKSIEESINKLVSKTDLTNALKDTINENKNESESLKKEINKVIDNMFEKSVKQSNDQLELIRSDFVKGISKEFKQQIDALKLEFVDMISKIENNKPMPDQNNSQLTNDEKKKLIDFINKKIPSNPTVKQCQKELATLKSNFMTVLDQKNINKPDNENKADIITQIRNGEFEAGREEVEGLGENKLKILISSVYNKNILYAEKVIEFLNTFTIDEDILLGYWLLFEEMIKNDHIYTTPTTTLAYRVLIDFAEIYPNNENLIMILENIPESLKTFPWTKKFILQNVEFKEYIDIGPTQVSYDNLRRFGLTYFTKSGPSIWNEYELTTINNGLNFHISTSHTSEYLIVDTNTLDNVRRRVLTWKRKNKDLGQWQLETIKNEFYFKIKNVHSNEYLYIENGFKFERNQNYRYLFTLRNEKCENEGCKWNIKESNF